MTPLNKTEEDPQLLARVLEDARRVEERVGRAYGEMREEILLKNHELFQRWSDLTGGRTLIAYFARFEHPNSAMQPSDIAPITALMERGTRIENLDLLIHSPGGIAQTAEKIVAACREVCEGEFRVAVPNMAKSAATMTALCADQIVMGYLSVSPAWIAEMQREIAFGQDIVGKHLKRHMLPRLHPGDDARALGRRASRIARDLSQADKRFTHGRMIGAVESRDELGLDVEVLPREDQRWTLLWEIYVRMEIFMQTFSTPGSDGLGPAKMFADAEEIQLSG
jgi:hypothetical protein